MIPLASRPRPRSFLRAAILAAGVVGAGACRGDRADRGDAPAGPTPLVVFNAGSLARPLRAALDSFARVAPIAPAQESAGSLETARKLTELGRTPDVIALADQEVFPALLVPRHTRWYARFARNRMVLAYGARATGADRIGPGNWTDVLTAGGVEVGRSDPDLDPAGYRALLVMQLAERFYRRPGLARRLLAASPARDVRAKSADLVALVQAGELDYAWEYESVARAAGLRFVPLPPEIDLGNPADSAVYAAASVRVRGAAPGSSLVMRGAPILFALSTPTAAPHPAMAARFVRWLLSPDGRRVLRREGLDVLDPVQVVGEGAPLPPGPVPAGAAR